MRKGRTSTISLPIERASQLRSIAAAHGLSISELMRKYIEAEIEAGVIANTVPGFRVAAVNDLIEFEIPGRTIILTRKEAVEIAGYLKSGGTCNSPIELEKCDLHIEIHLRGRGLVIRSLEKARMRTWRGTGLSRSTIPWSRLGLSQSTARDLAQLLRQAAE